MMPISLFLQFFLMSPLRGELIYRNNKKVTSVKLVLFKYVMSFETLTKVDQLTEIVGFG